MTPQYQDLFQLTLFALRAAQPAHHGIQWYSVQRLKPSTLEHAARDLEQDVGATSVLIRGVVSGNTLHVSLEPVESAELEKSRNLAKGRFLLQLENPQGMIMFGLRREVLEGEAVDPQELLEGLDAVTAEEIQRVAQDVIRGNGLNLALIGPFDEAEKFEQLLS